MKLLYVAHRLPYPPDKGDRIRSCHQLEFLAARHEVWCAAFVDDPDHAAHAQALRQWCARVHVIPLSRPWAACRGALQLATGGTITEGYYRRAEMTDVLRRWSAETDFDAALLFSSGTAPYRAAIRARRVVLDFCDFDSFKWQAYAERAAGLHSWLYATESRRLRRRERQWLDAFDACTVVTGAEARAFRDAGHALSDRLHVVQNGVDLGPEPGFSADCANPVIGFVGQMDYPPNVDAVQWFVNLVLPQVRARVPEVVFEIVGRAPTRAVQALACDKTILIRGAVPDVRPHLERFAVGLAPLRIGRGIQNKVLEAMAAARPVVLTSVAAAGIAAVDGIHFRIADEPRAHADAIVRLLADPTERGVMGRAARQWVAQRHSWPRELARLETLLMIPS